LTHGNLFGEVHQDPFSFDSASDTYLSILPLAHIFARDMNVILLAWGVSVYYLNDVKSVGQVCRTLHPTILVVVPRILERVYSKMLTVVHEAGFMKRTIGQWAFDLARSEQGLFKQLMHPVADKVVYSALREALGGKIRVVITGGAALNPDLNRFFIEIGVPIYEGWGLTEACPLTVNTPSHLKVGTVGRPFDRVELSISDEGEVLVRGPLVMRGYFKSPESTAKAIDRDGWLHTGDKGTIDADGYLTLIGRMKELFKTSTGEYIAPVPLEQALSNAPLIDMAMVVAENRKFASCLLYPDFEVLQSLKSAHRMNHLSDEEFLNSEFVKTEMDKLFDTVNAHLNHWEQLHGYRFIPHHPTIDSGELTPSMKIRRDFVTKKYKYLIDEIYEEKENGQ
jgi:long-chain acyl-CoA synthetase